MSDPEVFKYWSELAAKDPTRFKKERREVIEEAPEKNQQHLRELQKRIDTTRVDDPLESCKRLSQLMIQEIRYLIVMGNDLSWELERLAIARKSCADAGQNLASDVKSEPTFDGEAQITSILRKG